jgi:hypothetical protein
MTNQFNTQQSNKLRRSNLSQVLVPWQKLLLSEMSKDRTIE